MEFKKVSDFGLSKWITLLSISLVLFSCHSEEELPKQVEETSELNSDFSITPIPNQYIVVFQEEELGFRKTDNYETDLENMRKEVSGFFRKYKLSETDLEQIYTFSLPGFVAKIDSSALRAIRMDSKIKYIEQDRYGMLGKPVDSPPLKGNLDQEPSTQTIPWGIQRVKGPVNYQGRHSVFVVDTGIDIDHPDLNLDTQKGFDAYNPKKKDWNMDDDHGHGTHVAGIIGAKDNSFGVVGVAAGVPVIPVKVFYGPWAEFTYSGLIAGIEHIGVRGIPGDVANLSFGGFDESTALDEAVLNVSSKRRIYMVIASGNSRLPGDSFSPARVQGPYTITVSAIDSRDNFAWFSHYGSPIKYAAPGVSILSTWRGGGYRFETGTSMAAPHVAGIRALGEIGIDGFALNYPISPSDPIAVISGN